MEIQIHPQNFYLPEGGLRTFHLDGKARTTKIPFLDSMGGALSDKFSRVAREFDFAAEADVRAATKAIKSEGNRRYHV